MTTAAVLTEDGRLLTPEEFARLVHPSRCLPGEVITVTVVRIQGITLPTKGAGE